jgi:alkylhydroperoxidase family enzyme
MKRSVLPLALLLASLSLNAVSAQETNKVSRLPALKDPMSDPIINEMWTDTRARGGAIINLHMTQAHAPKMARASRTMAYALRFDATTPRLLREIVILRTAQILNFEYEYKQHVPLGLRCGMTQAHLDQMATWRESKLFDDRQRALLGYVDQVVQKMGEVDDPTFAEFARFFSPQEIVELTMVIGSYVGTGLLTTALRVEVETDGRGAAPGNC